MSGVTLRGAPAVPWISTFTEMNLRTYVAHRGRPGVFFLRMDASRALAVWAARFSLGLPYVWSSMRVRQDDTGSVYYSSRRGSAVFEGSYAAELPAHHPEPASPESLEAFLTERYCLYSPHRGRLLRVDIHHAPWPLEPAVVEIRSNTIPESCGLPPQTTRPIAHLSRRQDVIGWSATAVTGEARRSG